jgi:hypothetical protein
MQKSYIAVLGVSCNNELMPDTMSVCLSAWNNSALDE